MNESFGPLEAALAQDPGWSPSPEGAAAAAASQVAAEADQVKDEEMDNATPPEPKEDDDVQSVSSSTTSSSASDCSAMGSDLEGVLAEASAEAEARWFVQSRRAHIVSGMVENRQVPYCRDAPFIQDPKSQGEGFGLVGRSSFCQRCLARMPRGLYAALADKCGWLH